MRPSVADTNRRQRMQKAPIDTTIPRYSRDATRMSTAVKLMTHWWCRPVYTGWPRVAPRPNKLSAGQRWTALLNKAWIYRMGPSSEFFARAQAKAGEVSAYNFG